MNIKEIKNSFENLKQRLYKTEGQKAAAELNKVIIALNEASAEQNNTDKYKKAIQKIYAAVGKAEDVIKNSENIADLHSLISKLSAIKVGDVDINIEIDKLISSILKFQKKVQNSTEHSVSHISVHLLSGLADTARRYNNKGNVNEAKKILASTLDILQRFNTKDAPTDINTEASNLIKRIKAMNV